VPAGTAILFPIANSWCDAIGWEPPPTDQELQDCASGGQAGAVSMTMEVDGVAIKGLDPAATTPYRVLAPPFEYTIPDDNIYTLFGYDIPGQTTRAAADGVYVLLAPLSAGEHVIRSTALFGGGFAIDTTYYLTVGANCGD
jgi:hypothetical protein